MKQISVLFICTGNICRSPTAEGVFSALLERHGLEDKIKVDSAGTIAFHEGEAPDRRSQATALKRGYDLSAQRSRPVLASDCEAFDYIVTMDAGHTRSLQRICTANQALIAPLLRYAPELGLEDVPDPYYGVGDGFEQVLDLIEHSCEKLLNVIIQEHFS